MKKRNPIVIYLLMQITVYFYFLFWFKALLEDLNTLKGENTFDIKKVMTITTFFVVSLVASTLGSIMLPFTSSVVITKYIVIAVFIQTALFLVGIIMLCIFLKKIIGTIALLEKQGGVEVIISYGVTILLLFFNAFSFPYIQVHMNKIIGKQEYNYSESIQ